MRFFLGVCVTYTVGDGRTKREQAGDDKGVKEEEPPASGALVCGLSYGRGRGLCRVGGWGGHLCVSLLHVVDTTTTTAQYINKIAERHGTTRFVWARASWLGV